MMILLLMNQQRGSCSGYGGPMCNLYSITTNQAAIIALFRVINRYIGNLPPMSGCFLTLLLRLCAMSAMTAN